MNSVYESRDEIAANSEAFQLPNVLIQNQTQRGLPIVHSELIFKVDSGATRMFIVPIAKVRMVMDEVRRIAHLGIAVRYTRAGNTVTTNVGDTPTYVAEDVVRDCHSSLIDLLTKTGTEVFNGSTLFAHGA